MELNEIKHYLGTGLKMWSDEEFPFGESEFDRHTIELQHWNITGATVGKLKPILRPLSDLIKPCLEGGKIPIVELAKIAYDNIFHINEDFYTKEVLSESENFGVIAYYDKERVSFTVQKECSWFEFCFYVDGSELHLNKLELFNWLYEHYFWLGDQSRFEKDIIDINSVQ
jgi:hypothetical protein